jgi:hypothetical protein
MKMSQKDSYVSNGLPDRNKTELIALLGREI